MGKIIGLKKIIKAMLADFDKYNMCKTYKEAYESFKKDSEKGFDNGFNAGRYEVLEFVLGILEREFEESEE